MRAGSGWPTQRLEFEALGLCVVLAIAYLWSVDLRATRGASITGDEPFYLLTTQSLLRDGDLDLRNQYQWQSYREFFDHEQPLWLQSADRPGEPLLSPHDPGLAVYLVPGFAAGGLRGAQLQLALTAALTYALAYVLVARRTGLHVWAWLATVGVGLTAPAFVYATEVYPEVLASLCLVVSLLVVDARWRDSRVGAVVGAVILAGLVSMLAWLGVKYVPLGAVVGLAALWWLGRSDARAVFIGASIASGAVYVGWHLSTYGALTAYSSSWAWAGAGTAEVVADHLSLVERAYRLTGLFVDERFGLGRWAPLLLLTLPAIAALALRPGLSRLASTLLVVQLLMATFVALTMMGWWFPGRTIVAVLPLAGWGLVELLRQVPRWMRAAIGAAGAYSVGITATLVSGVSTGEVVVAVNPYALSSTLFRVTASAFPDYRAWTAETVALHAVWTSAFVLGIVLSLTGERPGIEAMTMRARVRSRLDPREQVHREQVTAGVRS